MDKDEQTLVEHLTDLRKVLLRSLIFFIFCFAVCLVSINRLIPLLSNQHELVMLGPLDVIKMYTGIAGSISLGLSLPFIAYQVWLFVKPALTEKESRLSIMFFPAILFSFIGGLCFGFFIIFPTIYQFLMLLGESHFSMMITAREYFSFLLMSTIPFGFLFEVPLLLLFLTAIGIVTPAMLSSMRKYAYVIMAVVSALITPPDLFSQILVLIPLIGLYEIGVLLSRARFKKLNAVKGTSPSNEL
ncbi:twin-arginine translocase subunit TatC [Bacillus sp. ISL-47]|uniref:twin-arginine translocase subunit TatC n=1 Tax=Bacillus sp. ISL-47 TaxID=2819130 RepID=UPI001BEC29F6|nr:twin-arginine translocase subunit TatC [Bacillus sp. ISL-47]MBT2688428.1 twin-arginine translocase subunit TatC [Bacillus sp. ISL-47]MBT2707256.1 twin-arginine translocase subunit TatC [Pseudomonas sp. ISL-84]